MKSYKIFAAALMLVFAISLTSTQACDKNQAKNTTGKSCTTVKTASNSECTTNKDASNTSVEASNTAVKAECTATVKTNGTKCPSSCTSKTTKLEAKNNVKVNTPTIEKASVSPNTK